VSPQLSLICNIDLRAMFDTYNRRNVLMPGSWSRVASNSVSGGKSPAKWTDGDIPRFPAGPLVSRDDRLTDDLRDARIS